MRVGVYESWGIESRYLYEILVMIVIDYSL